MIKNFLSYDGKLIGFLNKIGEIILVNVMFLLCCVPVVTIASSLTSFYYAMIKSVRRERGSPVKEFMHSMKRTFARGIPLTLVCIGWLAVLIFGRDYAGQAAAGAEGGITFSVLLYNILLLVTVCVMVYVFPVFSRFEMKMTGIVKLSFVMCIRFFPVTLAAVVGGAAVGWLVIYKLPIGCILVVPGVWCYLLTYLMEKALTHYQPEAEDGEESWFDE